MRLEQLPFAKAMHALLCILACYVAKSTRLAHSDSIVRAFAASALQLRRVDRRRVRDERKRADARHAARDACRKEVVRERERRYMHTGTLECAVARAFLIQRSIRDAHVAR